MGDFASQIIQNSVLVSTKKMNQKEDDFISAMRPGQEAGLADFIQSNCVSMPVENNVAEEDSKVVSDQFKCKKHHETGEQFGEFYKKEAKSDSVDISWMQSSSRAWGVPIDQRELRVDELN